MFYKIYVTTNVSLVWNTPVTICKKWNNRKKTLYFSAFYLEPNFVLQGEILVLNEPKKVQEIKMSEAKNYISEHQFETHFGLQEINWSSKCYNMIKMWGSWNVQADNDHEHNINTITYGWYIMSECTNECLGPSTMAKSKALNVMSTQHEMSKQ